MRAEGWIEVADGVLRRVGDPVDVNCVLVPGRDRCLLVDTGSTLEEGRVLRAAALHISGDRELVLANTHFHYDHCFGNSAFPQAEIWASSGCVEALRTRGGEHRAEAAAEWESENPNFARQLVAAPITIPNREVCDRVVLDLGGRRAELVVVGRGHTDHDLVVWLPEERMLLAGDLVEESGPPQFGDSWPLAWPPALERLLSWEPAVVVPGHGQPVGPEFVGQQMLRLRALAAWCRAAPGGSAASSPPAGWTEEALKTASERVAAELAG